MIAVNDINNEEVCIILHTAFGKLHVVGSFFQRAAQRKNI
jgi:hypothetical protein